MEITKTTKANMAAIQATFDDFGWLQSLQALRLVATAKQTIAGMDPADADDVAFYGSVATACENILDR